MTMNPKDSSLNPQAAVAEPVGPMRKLIRWAVPRWGAVTFLLVGLVVGACGAAWWLGLQQGLRGASTASTGLVTLRFYDATGRVCLAGAGVCLVFLVLFCIKGQPFFPGWHPFHFGVRQRQRIFEGRPIGSGLLRAYGALGLTGFALGLGLALKLAAAIGWRDPAVTPSATAVELGLLSLAVLFMSGRLVRDVLVLRDFDYFVGGKPREYAAALLAEEQQESEAEREYDRKSLRGWAFIVLVGGFGGGLLLAARLFSEQDGFAASQASISGMVPCAAGLYLCKTQPHRWRLWLAMLILAAIGFLIFTRLTWGGSPLCLLLGVLWGAVVGTTSARLYLPQLNPKPRHS